MRATYDSLAEDLVKEGSKMAPATTPDPLVADRALIPFQAVPNRERAQVVVPMAKVGSPPLFTDRLPDARKELAGGLYRNEMFMSARFMALMRRPRGLTT